jgi:hypothetical protein
MGAAIYADIGITPIDVLDSNFYNCRSESWGGAIAVPPTSVTLARLCGEFCWSSAGGMLIHLGISAGSRLLTQLSILGCAPAAIISEGSAFDGAVYFLDFTDATLTSINLTQCVSCEGYAGGVSLVGTMGNITMRWLTFFRCGGSWQIYNQRRITTDGVESPETVSLSFSNCYDNAPVVASLYAPSDGFCVSDCVFNQEAGTYFCIGAPESAAWKFRVTNTVVSGSRPSTDYIEVWSNCATGQVTASHAIGVASVSACLQAPPATASKTPPASPLGTASPARRPSSPFAISWIGARSRGFAPSPLVPCSPSIPASDAHRQSDRVRPTAVPDPSVFFHRSLAQRLDGATQPPPASARLAQTQLSKSSSDGAATAISAAGLGAIVAGSLVAAGAIVTAAWFLCRRRGSDQKQPIIPSDDPETLLETGDGILTLSLLAPLGGSSPPGRGTRTSLWDFSTEFTTQDGSNDRL